MSSAPAARAVASACGKNFGDTKHKFVSIIFFIARATAPIFPACEVSTNTILILSSKANVHKVKKALSLAKYLLNY
jgi:hypothetical protein